jgi:hypothetical protein
MLREAVSRYDGRLAFVLCPTPLNAECNPYIPRDEGAFINSCELARISLAVWVADREMYPAFENWMFTFESGDRWQPRSPGSARTRAMELVNREKYEKAYNDPWISQYLQICTRIFGQTIRSGRGGIPKLVYGSRWVIPEPANANDLVRIIKESLGVPGE